MPCAAKLTDWPPRRSRASSAKQLKIGRAGTPSLAVEAGTPLWWAARLGAVTRVLGTPDFEVSYVSR